MSNLVKIEHLKQRVLTTAQLAESYGVDQIQIQQNFNNNKNRFIECKHYYLLQGEELREFKHYLENFEVVAERAPRLYLWTEKGAWMVAKSLNTDQAWGAYEMLVDDYYQIRNETPTLETLSPQLQLLIGMELKQKEIENKVALIEQKTLTAHQRIDSLDAINIEGDLQQRFTSMVRKYARQEGLTYPKAWNDFVVKYNAAYHANLNLARGHCEEKLGKKLTIPQYLAKVNKLEDAIRVADKMLNIPVLSF